tara:strand:- start:36 stop:167 length:132 start_codon:yes stop_codon:yes gene_type:complete
MGRKKKPIPDYGPHRPYGPGHPDWTPPPPIKKAKLKKVNDVNA